MMKHKIRAYIIVSVLLAGCSPVVKRSLPVCYSAVDVQKYDRREVRLVGTYNHKNAGKCWVAELLLKDSCNIILRYQPSQEEVRCFNNKKVIVIGKILQSAPGTDEPRQWIVAPHLVDIKSISMCDQKSSNR